jgi:hypothetical protein
MEREEEEEEKEEEEEYSDVGGREEIFNEVSFNIQRWKPQKEYLDEDGYRDDLIGFLRNVLNKPKPDLIPRREIQHLIQPQHFVKKESRRHSAGVNIAEKVGVEVKRNLQGKVEADRLIGQVDGFLREYPEGVIIVLCGKTDIEQLEYLRNSLSRYSKGNLFGGRRVQIILVKPKDDLQNRIGEGEVEGGQRR